MKIANQLFDLISRRGSTSRSRGIDGRERVRPVRSWRPGHSRQLMRRLDQVALVLFLLVLHDASSPVSAATLAEGPLPDPTQVFTPRTVFAFYAHISNASQSAIWKAIEERARPLVEQAQSLPHVPAGLPKTAQMVPGFNGSNLVEIAVALEGEKAFSGLESGQWDPASGFVAAARLLPGTEVESLVQQVLEVAEKEKPGLRSQLEKSRRRLGAAEFFELPAELLGEDKPPFSVSFAVGPG